MEVKKGIEQATRKSGHNRTSSSMSKSIQDRQREIAQCCNNICK